MSTQDIADELNKNGWYKKKDGSAIQAFQIHGRTRNYAQLFEREGSMVSLVSQLKAPENRTASKNPKRVESLIRVKSENTKYSFASISNPETNILILGTMPGERSIELGEYYAHHRNRFWKIISTITGNPTPTDYSEKLNLLRVTNIGVWDVAYRVNRKGSLDSEISDEVPNDVDGFINSHKNLKVIGFNGTNAEALFDKFFTRNREIKYVSLPSTSPANTGIGFESICEKWKQLIVE